MAVRKLSVSVPEDIAEAARAAARAEGMGFSAWVTNAVLAQLGDRERLEIGRRAARELEAEVMTQSGSLSAEEIAWVESAVEKILGREPGASARRGSAG